jgi:hypothetical protein
MPGPCDSPYAAKDCRQKQAAKTEAKRDPMIAPEKPPLTAGGLRSLLPESLDPRKRLRRLEEKYGL